jgi:uncharacterized membrane protein (Fun14 family)
MKLSHPQLLEHLQARFQTSPGWLIEAGFYGLISLIIGFLARNFARTLLLAIIGTVCILYVFQHLHIISIDMLQLQSFFGLQNISSSQEVLDAIKVWIHTYPTATFSMVIGFFAGWVIG